MRLAEETRVLCTSHLWVCQSCPIAFRPRFYVRVKGDYVGSYDNFDEARNAVEANGGGLVIDS